MFPAPHEKALYSQMKRDLHRGITPAQFNMDNMRFNGLLSMSHVPKVEANSQQCDKHPVHHSDRLVLGVFPTVLSWLLGQKPA